MGHFGLPIAMFVPGILEILVLGVVVGVPAIIAIVAIILVTSKKNRPLHSGELIPCPDCNNAVSRRAQTCPHCGAPLKPMA